jgi:hypothetical protein
MTNNPKAFQLRIGFEIWSFFWDLEFTFLPTIPLFQYSSLTREVKNVGDVDLQHLHRGEKSVGIAINRLNPT